MASKEKNVVVPKTLADLQRIRLEKLMKNPAKPVTIAEKSKEWQPKAPHEFIRNVWGSSAGAGSGDFHVYRGVRRREYARQKFITEKSAKDEADEKYKQKVEQNQKEAEERAAKKRKKRLKKKQKMKSKKSKKELEKKDETDEEEEDDIDDNSQSDSVDKDNDNEEAEITNEDDTGDYRDLEKTSDTDSQPPKDDYKPHTENYNSDPLPNKLDGCDETS